MTKVPELKHRPQEKVTHDSVEKALLRNKETSEFSFYLLPDSVALRIKTRN